MTKGGASSRFVRVFGSRDLRACCFVNDFLPVWGTGIGIGMGTRFRGTGGAFASCSAAGRGGGRRWWSSAGFKASNSGLKPPIKAS